jgi:hypothetical protein
VSRRELALLAPILIALGAVTAIVAAFLEREAQARVRERARADQARRAEERPDFEFRVGEGTTNLVPSTLENVDVEDVCDLVRREVRQLNGAHPWAGEYADSELGRLCLAPNAGFEWTDTTHGDIWGPGVTGSVRETEDGIELVSDAFAYQNLESLAHLVPISRGESRFLMEREHLQDRIERLRDEAGAKLAQGGGIFRRFVDTWRLPAGELVIPEKYRRSLIEGISAEVVSGTSRAHSNEPSTLTINAGRDEGAWGGLRMYLSDDRGASCEIEIVEVGRGSSTAIERAGDASLGSRFSSLRPRR